MNSENKNLNLNLKSQELAIDSNGYNVWRTILSEKKLLPQDTALLICDMWDDHWSRGAAERVNAMVLRMNEVVSASRDIGIQIIHSPSDTMKYYETSPARQRIINATQMLAPVPMKHADFPIPIDDSDNGSDTYETEEIPVWTRQHASIKINEQVDGISDDGREIFNFLQSKAIKNLLMVGVHTNMCILNRSFGIKQMVKWGINPILVRDLTDSLYNPAKAPYVSHDEGTKLVIEYIEKFWCPSILSKDIRI